MGTETQEQHLAEICAKISDVAAAGGINERELVTLFAAEGFFSSLGYSEIGSDVRLEQRFAGGRTDVILWSFSGRPVCLLEFKAPDEDLFEHLPQLREYAEDLIPTTAVLTNGRQIWTYLQSDGAYSWQKPHRIFDLSDLGDQGAGELFSLLHRREIEWDRAEGKNGLLAALSKARSFSIDVDEPDRSGGKQFLRRFQLDKRSPFGRLTNRLNEALSSALESSEFTRGAYEFWLQAYARDLKIEDAPSTWRTLIIGTNQRSLKEFMFSLETAYSVLSRLMLAKAMGDTGLPHTDAIESFQSAMVQQQRHGTFRMGDYFVATSKLFEAMGMQAFESLFASDIFDWWQDAAELDGMAELAESFGEAAIGVFDFNFGNLTGDLLGALYQTYFDAETRKALGEFYTPPEIVEFILDRVDYHGPSITTRRLLDPACGSGTFLIYALRRYLDAGKGTDPRETLRQLIDGLAIVGFDINPFAVMMARVNYAAQILPIYADVLKSHPRFSVSDIPIFRTDSLRREVREEEEAAPEPADSGDGSLRQLGLRLVHEGNLAHIRAELPVREKTGKGPFLEIVIPVPRYDRAQELGIVGNIEDYFAVLRGMFWAVRTQNVNQDSLEELFSQQEISNPSQVASFVLESSIQILETIERLQTEYQDGRFLKTIEDLALALILKNDLKSDYVVGNPPYVRIQSIPELFRRRWEAMYEWPQGNYDIYIPFIERGITEWLNPGGALGYICSNRFLLADYATGLRTNLPEHATVELLIDFRDTNVFRDAMNYPAIIILRHEPMPKQEEFSVVRAFADPPEFAPEPLLEEISRAVRGLPEASSKVVGDFTESFRDTASHLQTDAWYLMPEDERSVFEKMAGAAPAILEDLTLTRSGGFQGYSTSLDDVLILRSVGEDPQNGLLRVQPKGGGPVVSIETELLKPFLFGRDVERWKANWMGWFLLFPYTRVEGKYRLIPSTKYAAFFDYYREAPFLDEEFTHAWDYLSEHEARLRARESNRFRVGGSGDHQWYAATAPRSIDLYEGEKLVVQILSQWPDFSFDGEGYYFQAGGRGGGVYGILPNTNIVNPWHLLGLLNSAPIDFYLKQISTIYGAKTYSYSDGFISRLPIAIDGGTRLENGGQSVASLAEELTKLKAALRETESRWRSFPMAELAQSKDISDVFPAERLADGRPQSRTYRPSDAVYGPSLEGGYTMSFGLTALFFPSEAHVRVLERWSACQERTTLETKKLMGVPLPRAQHDCHRILDSHAKLRSQIKSICDDLAKLENELNQLVADRYRLDTSDLKVVMDFLERYSFSSPTPPIIASGLS